MFTGKQELQNDLNNIFPEKYYQQYVLNLLGKIIHGEAATVCFYRDGNNGKTAFLNLIERTFNGEFKRVFNRQYPEYFSFYFSSIICSNVREKVTEATLHIHFKQDVGNTQQPYLPYNYPYAENHFFNMIVNAYENPILPV
jgi:hypothetical protein